MNDHTLLIRHIKNDSDSFEFELTRLRDGKRTDRTTIESPDRFPVEGRPDSNLAADLRWYLEKFLDYPFSPDTELALRIQESLIGWGEKAFNALFDNREGGKMLDAIADAPGGYGNLHLQIASDDPRVLSWPWEALRDPKANYLAHACRIERRLDGVIDPTPISGNLPKERVNILLVTARPYENDVRYRSISRLLVELIRKQNLPAYVHLLRPPTFEALREHLRENPNRYHILHFDGHGAYGNLEPLSETGANAGYKFQGREGCLIFEKENGEPDAIRAETLSSLLREFALPVVVLNACQSAMIDESARNGFASVATALIQAGVRSVVAMSWSLYVSGAQVFLPDFYRRLFESGNVGQAVQAGRQKMLARPERICPRGKYPLEDWVVPALYQQDPLDFSFVSRGKCTDGYGAEFGAGAGVGEKGEKSDSANRLPPEILEEENPYDFIGRDGAILELERAMRGKTPALLIHGLGGVGKTTLAKGFVKWLDETRGLDKGCFWFAFNEIRNAESVFNRMGEALFGGNFALAGLEERIEALTGILKQHAFVVVWDNFEVVRGIPGSEVKAVLSEGDRGLLKRFLQKLRGGRSKVLITSRSEEAWLGTERRKIGVRGLEGEERWLFLEEILGNLGIRVNREDRDLVELLEILAGHPLSMRVMLPMLEKRSAGDLIQAVKTGLDLFKQVGDGVRSGADGEGSEEYDAVNARFYATLLVARTSLPEDARELLVPVGMHERFVDLDLLEGMAGGVDGGWTRDRLHRFAETMVHMGLFYDRGNGIFELHPALTGYLRSEVFKDVPGSVRDGWGRAFVDGMGSLADQLAPKEVYEQRGPFHLFGASFYFAMNEAERLDMFVDRMALIQGMAEYARKSRNYAEAMDLFERLAREEGKKGRHEDEAVALHQLGMIAAERRDFPSAEKWYRKSLEISEKHGNEHGAAITYHQLGMIAAERRDFPSAEKWYRKSLEISEKHGNENVAAITYHQLGIIAAERRDFPSAEKWYRKSLEIKEKHGNEHGAAITYHQLGRIAEERRDFPSAEKWYRKSLEIKEKHGNEHGAAITYHQLGRIAEERRDFPSAEKWYRKSLEIKEKHGNEHGAAITYHQLGRIAEERRDFPSAEKWYRKSLEIKEKHGNEHGAALTYHQLGMIAEERRDFPSAEKWYRKSLEIKEKHGNEHGAASTLGQLGILFRLRGSHEMSGQWLIRCVQGFDRTDDPAGVQQAIGNFIVNYKQAPPTVREKLKSMWEQAGLGDFPDIPPEEFAESAPAAEKPPAFSRG